MATPRRISHTEWEGHKSVICRLYIDQDLPLPRVTEQMARHGFEASDAQYKRQLKRWKLRKNQTGDLWKNLSQKLKHDNLGPDNVEVFLHGILIPSQKLRKEMSRYDLPTMRPAAASCHNETRLAAPNDIRICLKLHLPRQLVLRLPWYGTCDQLKASFSTTISRKTDRSPSPLPTRCVQDQTYFLDWETVESQDGEVGSLGVEDHIDEVRMQCRNSTESGRLPWFAHQSDIRVGVNIASVFDLPAWLSRSDAFTKSKAQMAPFVPERFPNETKASVKELLDPTSTTRMQILTSFMALVLANGLLLPLQMDGFLICLDEVAGNIAFDVLALSKEPSTRAIVSQLFFSAVRLNQPRLVRSALRNGVDANLKSSGYNSCTLIREAVNHGRVEILQLLTDAGATITAGTPRKPIRHDPDCPARSEDSVSCSSPYYNENSAFYCPCEANILLEASDVGTAAKSRHADDLVPWLLKSPLPASTGPVLTEVILRGAGYRTIKVLLQAGASANECSPYSFKRGALLKTDIDEWNQHNCPLSAAISRGDSDMVHLLLEHGANPNGPIVPGNETIMQHWGDFLYKTPLVVAVGCASLDIVKVLLQYRADPNWSTFDTLRARERKELIAKCHFKRVGRVNSAVRLFMLYPLQAAASLASPEIAGFLLDHGAAATPGQGTSPLSIAAYFSRTETVDLLIKRNALINSVNADHFAMSPLEGAVLSGSHELVKRLISAGADPNQCSTGVGGKTPLQRASETGSASMFEALVEAGATLDSSSVPDHASKLLPGFVRYRHHGITMKLLQQGADPDGNDVVGLSPLSAAIWSKDLDLISLLLTWGANPNKQSSMLPYRSLGRLDVSLGNKFLYIMRNRGSLVPPLHNAIIVGDPDIVACLCHFGSDVNKTSTEGLEDESKTFPHLFTALHLAVRYEDRDLVELLLTRGARINWPRPQEPHILESPLSVSVRTGNRDITELLIRYGADPNDGYIESNREDEEARIDWVKRLPLEEACFRGDCQMVRCLISGGASALVGYPLVFLFSPGARKASADAENIRERAEIMDLLLEHRVNVDQRCDFTHSALQAAIIYAGRFTNVQDERQRVLRCARRLIGLGADVNAAPVEPGDISIRPRTALAAAAEIGDVDLVQCLLSKGARVNAPAGPQYGVTALQAAAIEGYLRIAQILLEQGADIDADPSAVKGRRAIDGAAERGRIDMVKFLLDNYNGPRPMSKVLASAMKYAKRENQWYVMELLEQYKPPERGAPTVCSGSFDQGQATGAAWG